MSDSLRIWGTDYTGVNGFKAKDANGNTHTYGIDSGGGGTPSLQSKTVTPSESVQTVTADSGYDGLSDVEVGAISGTYVGSQVARRSSSDLTTNGATVTTPAGYYAASASKSVASGSATTPATTIVALIEAEVTSSGQLRATASGSESVTPTVVEGYVSAGTAGTISVSGGSVSQLPTLAAQTITPNDTTQIIGAAGRWTLGPITVNPIPANRIDTSDATAAAGDIVSGKSAYVNGSKVNGSLVIQHYYTGSTAPSSSLGSDGDIYLQTGS